MEYSINQLLEDKLEELNEDKLKLGEAVNTHLDGVVNRLEQLKSLLNVLSPLDALKRGYAVLRLGDKVVSSGKLVAVNDELSIELADARINSIVKDIKLK